MNLPGWHGVANATLKDRLATPVATPVGSDKLNGQLVNYECESPMSNCIECSTRLHQSGSSDAAGVVVVCWRDVLLF